MRNYIILIVLCSAAAYAQISTVSADSVDLNHNTILSINNMLMWARSDSRLSYSPHQDGRGIVYPKGGAEVVYCDGFLWAGMVNNTSEPQLKLGGSLYTTAMTPGSIIEPGCAENTDVSQRTIWNIRKDWETASLKQDAEYIFNMPDTIYHNPNNFGEEKYTEIREPTEAHIQAVRAMYQQSRDTWPWQKGAPFYDDNNNGVMDEGEEPGLLDADQVVWFVCNDLDEDKCVGFFGSSPIGMELQVTLWGYNREGGDLERALNQTVFRHYRLIYKGTGSTQDSARIDSMYVSMWCDCDVGGSSGDLVGCDTLLDLMFGYNCSSDYEYYFDKIDTLPSIGYAMVQGIPAYTGNADDIAQYFGESIPGYIDQGMVCFNYGSLSFTPEIITTYPILWYNVMRGLMPWDERPYPDAYGNPDNFPLSDDPSEGGDVDGIVVSPEERRMQMHSGPVFMELGDTLDIVVAVVGGMGSDNIASVSVMKYWAKWARYFFRNGMWNSLAPFGWQTDMPDSPVPGRFALFQNFPNPFNAETSIRYDIPEKSTVVIRVFNSLGREVAVLVNEKKEPGAYTARWDASGMPSGVYVYKMQAGAVHRAGKMVVMK